MELFFCTRLPPQLRNRIRSLRKEGKTYGEIRQTIGLSIPKSTLSYICRGTPLPGEYAERIRKLNLHGLDKGRRIAVEINKIKREHFLRSLTVRNTPIAEKAITIDAGKIALAMLCLGETSKYNPKKTRAFSLGSSDPKIIVIFLILLQQCFPFTMEKIRASVQCRADQDTVALEMYWREISGIPKHLFYKPLIDPRTVGKPTKKPDYRGVLRIYYFDTKIQLELESLADLIYNVLRS